MATANAVTKTVITGNVTLTMAVEEAETLRAVFSRIGGDPRTTRRGHTDALNAALRQAGVQEPGALTVGDASIYFQPESI